MKNVPYSDFKKSIDKIIGITDSTIYKYHLRTFSRRFFFHPVISDDNNIDLIGSLSSDLNCLIVCNIENDDEEKEYFNILRYLYEYFETLGQSVLFDFDFLRYSEYYILDIEISKFTMNIQSLRVVNIILSIFRDICIKDLSYDRVKDAFKVATAKYDTEVNRVSLLKDDLMDDLWKK